MFFKNTFVVSLTAAFFLQRGFKVVPDLQVDILIFIPSPFPGGILDSVSGGRADLLRSQWLKAADFLALLFLFG